MILQHSAAIDWKRSTATARVSLASVSMINGGFASKGQKGPLVQQMLKLLIITEETQMARTAIHPGEHLADELKEDVLLIVSKRPIENGKTLQSIVGSMEQIIALIKRFAQESDTTDQTDKDL